MGSPLLVARYLSEPTRQRIEREGAGYMDATGNILLTAASPSLLIRSSGADADPWRGPGRPRDTLRGAAAARVVQGLVGLRPPYTVPELVERTGSSTGATYRVVHLLDEEGLLGRTPRGPVTDVDWRGVIQRWSRDAGFMRSPSLRSFLAPRGLDHLMEQLQWMSEPFYALTGSLAAHVRAPEAAYAEASLAMLYASDVAAAADFLELRPVDTGANVLLASDEGTACFWGLHKYGGTRVDLASFAQIAVDLLTGPGRSPSEAAALMDWMETNELHWRL